MFIAFEPTNSSFAMCIKKLISKEHIYVQILFIVSKVVNILMSNYEGKFEYGMCNY